MKLPQVVAQVGTSASYPQPEASLSAGAAQTRALVAGGAAITQSATDFNTVYANAQEVLRKAEAKVEAETGINNVEGKFSDYKYALGQQGVNPDTYHDQLGQGLRDFATEEAKRLRHPESRAAFTSHMQKFARKEMDVARGEALQIRHGLVNTAEDLLMKEYATKAVYGKTPEEQNAAVRRGMEIPQEGLTSLPPRRTSAQVSAMTQAFLKDVQMGQIQRDMRDPAMRPAVISTLLNGGYEYIGGPDDQFKLAADLQKHSDQEYKQQREALEKWWTEQQGAKVLDLTKAAAAKTLTLAQLDVEASDWRLTGPQYTTIRKELTASVDEAPSNTVVWERTRADVHSMNPRNTEASLAALRALGPERGLNGKDYIAALDKLNSTNTARESKAHTIEGQQHAQAEQMGRAAFQIPAIYDRLEGNKGKVWSDYLEALTVRSKYMRGQENPLDVAEELIPRFKKILGDDASRDVTYLRGMLNYQTFPELKAAKASGAITPGQYDAEAKVLLQLDAAMQTQAANDEAAAKAKAEATRQEQERKAKSLLRFLPSFGAPPANAPKKENRGRE